MHLQRVQVPNFRALKNIDITFEKERIPRIFPLASLNGGGKSTLLQLIFTLLTCSADPDKHEFLVNLLKDFEIDYESVSTLARIELFDGNSSVILEFSCHNTCLLVDQLLPSDENNVLKEFGFIKCLETVEYLKKEIQLLEIKEKEIELEKLRAEKESVSVLGSFKMPTTLLNIQEGQKSLVSKACDLQLQQIKSIIKSKRDGIDYFIDAQNSREEILEQLLSNNTHYICSYRLNDDCDEINILCHISGSNTNTDILKEVSKKIFLAAPASQVFLFFNRQEIDCLFGNRTSGETYEHIVQENQDRLSGFFLHDFSTIRILAKAFEQAKENDWQQAIQTRGQYGTEYARISRDLEHVFSGKIIEPLKDLSGIIIKTIENGKERILHPEDLSHGELRRLTFYAWLRTKEIQDSIVLVDEIEIGLHPDWQYQIVKDLEEWAPSNQYILATHSYEICSALTPAHVKEIEPKLVKP